MCVCVCARCVSPSKHGSQLSDIDPFSDFTDFVSDMSRKGNAVLFSNRPSAVKQRSCVQETTGCPVTEVVRLPVQRS